MRSIWKTERIAGAGERLMRDWIRLRLPVAVLAAYMGITKAVFGTVCPWAILTHLPCPGCGLTRAGMCVLTLRPGEAFRWNAMIGLWMPYLCYFSVTRYLLGKKPRFLLAMAAGIAVITCVYFEFRVQSGTLPQDILPSKLYTFPSIW